VRWGRQVEDFDGGGGGSANTHFFVVFNFVVSSVAI
jgi:hypothetical protein